MLGDYIYKDEEDGVKISTFMDADVYMIRAFRYAFEEYIYPGLSNYKDKYNKMIKICDLMIEYLRQDLFETCRFHANMISDLIVKNQKLLQTVVSISSRHGETDHGPSSDDMTRVHMITEGFENNHLELVQLTRNIENFRAEHGKTHSETVHKHDY